MRQKFYIYRRKGNPIYFARFTDEGGGTLTERSTGCTGRDAAIFTVSGWLRDGLPPNKRRGNKTRLIEAEATLQGILTTIAKADTLDADSALEIVTALRDRGLIAIPTVKAGPGNVDFITFLENLWDYEKSPYIRERLAYGISAGKKHCYECSGKIKRYVKPYFNGQELSRITRESIKIFSFSLVDRGLSHASVNNIMAPVLTALKFAFKENMIPVDPTAGIMRFSAKTKPRGILTLDEAGELFKKLWNCSDLRAYTASKLAATTGLRIGEVQALKKGDFKDGILTVSHAWSAIDGLKCPKSGKPREIPLLPEIEVALKNLLEQNPFKETEDAFLFYSSLADKPMDGKLILLELKAAMDSVNEERKKENPESQIINWRDRRVCFHSWRHFFISYASKILEKQKAMAISGHLTESVFNHYADHGESKDLDQAREAMAEVFGKVLDFGRKTS
ncbi:site-specific integrase [Treponema primitia]|uniref:tyrosine-type recombinase/integrase n=1 Tax=Treponema primitia TaxID=88058 RepID=UPI00397F312F